MSTYTIRPYQEEDFDQVYMLLCELEKQVSATSEISIFSVHKSLGCMKKYPDSIKWTCALHEKRVIGFVAMMTFQSSLYRKRSALITELVVNQEYRRRGIAAMLIDHCRQMAINESCGELKVATRGDNQAARALYATCGFDSEYVLLSQDLPPS